MDYIGHYKTIKKPAKLDNLRAFGLLCILLDAYLVPTTGLEPAQPKSPPPQDGVSTNFTTSALIFILHFQLEQVLLEKQLSQLALL